MDDESLIRTLAGPHNYSPPPRLSVLGVSLTRRADYCRACYLPASAHPVDGWTAARPHGDRSAPRPRPVYERTPAGLRVR